MNKCLNLELRCDLMVENVIAVHFFKFLLWNEKLWNKSLSPSLKHTFLFIGWFKYTAGRMIQKQELNISKTVWIDDIFDRIYFSIQTNWKTKETCVYIESNTRFFFFLSLSEIFFYSCSLIDTRKMFIFFLSKGQQKTPGDSILNSISYHLDSVTLFLLLNKFTRISIKGVNNCAK